MTSARTLRLRRDMLTELGSDDLHAVAGAAVSLNTCLDCVEKWLSLAIQTCFTVGCTAGCLSGHDSCPC